MKRIILIVLLLFCVVLSFSCQKKTSSDNSTIFENVSWKEDYLVNSGLERTETPNLVEKRIVETGRVVFAGTCEDKATIFVEYDDKLLLSTKTVDGSFIFEINPKMETAPWDILIYAKAENKSISLPLKQTAEIGPAQESEFADYVWIGKDFRLFFTATESQYLKTSLMNEDKIKWLTETTKKRVETLKKHDIELIYLIIPNPNSVYSEFMPEGLVRPEGESLITQATRALEAGGATVIDMTDILMEHKNDEFAIYRRTDSHWTEYGAYFAYKELMNKIAEKFPAAAPRDISEFGFANESRFVGDLYFDLSMDITKLHENTVFANPKFETPYDGQKYKQGEIRIADETTGEILLNNPDSDGKPNVFIMRDSYSVMMFDFIAERCANTYLKPLWEFGFNEDEILSDSYDYVIYIISEMNIPNIVK